MATDESIQAAIPAAATPGTGPDAATAAVPTAPAATEAVSDPGDWVVPVACFHCQREYPVAVRHFRTGAVLYCAQCHGSYVVTRSMYGEVSDVVRGLALRCRGESAERVRATGDACTAALREVARGFRPPGAPRRRASMFG
jgi:hypothetical protein